MSKKDLYKNVHSSIIRNSHSSIVNWTNKLCYINTMQYYSTIKRSELLIKACKKFEELKNMFSKKYLTQMHLFCMIPFTWSFRRDTTNLQWQKKFWELSVRLLERGIRELSGVLEVLGGGYTKCMQKWKFTETRA